ncbi:relaxase domain-containing protein [Acidithiobacillus ferrivorans]|nr:relaxase domain-containing protein [Acidithiobacillus ferrivorans]
MIRVKALNGSAKDVAQYLGHEKEAAAVEYYSGSGQQQPSFWTGQLADKFGLDTNKPIQQSDLIALLEGKLPDGTDISGRAGDMDGKRRMGTEINFSAPKSFSLLVAAADPELRTELLQMWDDSVRDGLAYVESDIASARYGKGGKERAMAGKVIAAVYRHEDARPVDGHTDIHIHSHAALINVVEDRNGGYRSIDLDFGEQNVRMETADMIMKSRLSEKLERAGISIVRTKDGFEVAGITKEQIYESSSRKQQIDEQLIQDGTTRAESSHQQRDGAWQITREDKNTKKNLLEQQSEWRIHARRLGIDPQKCKRPEVTQDIPTINREKDDRAKIANMCLDFALDDLTATNSVFNREKLYLEAVKQGMGQVTIDDVKDALIDHKEIISAGKQKFEYVKKSRAGEQIKVVERHDMLTTKKVVQREGWLQGYCEEGKGKMQALMNSEDAVETIRQAEERQGFKFSAGQRKSLEATFTSADKIIGIVGSAGVGKTTSAKAIIDAARETGYETIGLTPSHTARQELVEAGTDVNITTARLLQNTDKVEGKPKLYLLDEAGMVGDRSMQEILKKLRAEDRILLSGDPDQLKAMEAGDTFKMLMDSESIAYSEIREVQRQKDADMRNMAQLFASRKTSEALEIAKNYMTEVEVTGTGSVDKKTGQLSKITTEDRRKAIADKTVERFIGLDDDQRKNTLIVCKTNAVREMVNNDIRHHLVDSGKINTQESVEVTRLTRTSLTAAQRSEARYYTVGQVMRMQERIENNGGNGKDTKTKSGIVDYEIKDINLQTGELTLSAKDRQKNINLNDIDHTKVQLYDKQENWKVAKGDTLVLRDNSQSKEYKAFNGDGGIVAEVKDGKITMKTDKGKTVIIDTKKQMLAADYGYARTVNDTQGKSVDRAIVTGESTIGDTANSLYVAATRQKNNLEIITDDPHRLCKTAEKWAEKNLAGTSRERVMDAEQVKDLETQLEHGKEQGRRASDAALGDQAQEKENKENKKHDEVIKEENKREELRVLEELEM